LNSSNRFTFLSSELFDYSIDAIHREILSQNARNTDIMPSKMSVFLILQNFHQEKTHCSSPFHPHLLHCQQQTGAHPGAEVAERTPGETVSAGPRLAILLGLRRCPAQAYSQQAKVNVILFLSVYELGPSVSFFEKRICKAPTTLLPLLRFSYDKKISDCIAELTFSRYRIDQPTGWPRFFCTDPTPFGRPGACIRSQRFLRRQWPMGHATSV